MKTVNVPTPRRDRWWAGKRGTCSTCGTEVELEEADRPRTSSDQRDGDWAEVSCPTCDRAIYINHNPLTDGRW